MIRTCFVGSDQDELLIDIVHNFYVSVKMDLDFLDRDLSY